MALPETRLAVALATWNGAAFLEEQLASLAAQTVPAHLVVGDDGSTDSTCALLETWRNRMPGGMTVLPPSSRLGAKANFSRVLAACDADWVACCDQDDVWDSDHLAVLLEAGQALPAKAPRLAVGDLAVVDGSLRPIHPSFRGHQAFDGQRGAELGCLAIMNIFPGCAMLADRSLLRAALPIPDEAGMHDWWLALVAAVLGRIAVVPRSIGRYRVHGGNALGAPAFSVAGRISRSLANGHRVRAAVTEASRQARALLQRHAPAMLPGTQRQLEMAARLDQVGWLQRRWLLVTGDLSKHPISRQVNLLLRG